MFCECVRARMCEFASNRAAISGCCHGDYCYTGLYLHLDLELTFSKRRHFVTPHARFTWKVLLRSFVECDTADISVDGTENFL